VHKAGRHRIVAYEPCNGRRLCLLYVVWPFAPPRPLERCGLTCEDAEAKDQVAMRNGRSGERADDVLCVWREDFAGQKLAGGNVYPYEVEKLAEHRWKGQVDGASISV
jgi:hypothetical protein